MRGFALSLLTRYPFLAFAPGSPQRIAQDDPFWRARRDKYTAAAANGYHPENALPFYGFLAQEYMISDRWYSSHPGPTFPNRFFYLSGHLGTNADGEPQRDNDTSSLRLLRSRTIQDALTERSVSWKMYESDPDVCMLRMFARYAFDQTNIRPVEEFYTDARAGKLPSVTFLEPQYHLGAGTNDDHPPADMALGQTFVRGVYEALTANAAAWNKTLFIITYDEHGGLHDHHVPDLADRYVQPGRPTVEVGYGVRVPAFIVSPWVPGGATTRRTTQAVFDHTSILKTIVNRFCPNDPAIMSDRMAFANDLFPLLTLATPRAASNFAAFNSGPGQSIGPLQPAIAQRNSVKPPPVRSIIDEARAQSAPLARGRQLFGDHTDWHQYMSRLALMLR
jgi:phospholipase C